VNDVCKNTEHRFADCRAAGPFCWPVEPIPPTVDEAWARLDDLDAAADATAAAQVYAELDARRLAADESGSASGRLVALICWSVTWTMLAFLLLVWFAPPGQAVRIVPGSPAASRDWCPNIEGTQSVQSYLWHYRIKVVNGHGPHAGEVRCLPRKSRGHK